MRDPDELIYDVWLSCFEFVSPAEKNFLLRIFETAEGIYRADDKDLTQAIKTYGELSKACSALLNKDLGPAKAQIKKAKDFGADALLQPDELYPPLLSSIPDPPLLLWYKGDPKLLEDPPIAIVGTRRCSPYGRWAAKEIASRIVFCEKTVISGMAEGIDAAAQNGAIFAGGRSIGVLGTGLDECFPVSNAKLYRELLDHHLLISEYPFGSGGRATQFPQRNRIISGMSTAVIIVEAAMRSGSLITAGLAAEQGRDVLAVPGNINQPGSVGTNRLIADGAAAISDLDRLPELLGIETKLHREKMRRMSEEEKAMMKLIKQHSGQPPGFLISLADMPAGQASALLSALELKGMITIHAGKVFATS